MALKIQIQLLEKVVTRVSFLSNIQNLLLIVFPALYLSVVGMILECRRREFGWIVKVKPATLESLFLYMNESVSL